MTDNMIEKVARAIHSCEAWSSFWSLDDARVLARAAIEAMRDETLAMRDAGAAELAAQWPNDDNTPGFAAKNVWASMIDAALKQP